MPLAGRRIGMLTSSASRLNGGILESVRAQTQIVRMLGGEAVVFALEDEFSAADRPRFGPTEVRVFPVRGPRQVGYAPALLPALLAAGLDTLHLHGIWMYPSRAGARWARATGRPYYISPRGMLDPWILRRGRWKKALARLGYERASWRAARQFHALTGREAAQVAAATGRTDSLVLPNPAPPLSPPPAALPPPQVIYIGRVHAKKNLVALAQGWAMAKLPAGARLTIAGFGDAADVAALEAAVAQAPGAAFVGPVYGADKTALLAGARFMVLPSHSEGLPLALLESWAAGVPTIQTDECNLPEGTAAGAAIECGYGPAEIAAALETALARDAASWRAMSGAAQALAGGPFAMATLARAWGEVYAAGINAGGRGAPPAAAASTR